MEKLEANIETLIGKLDQYHQLFENNQHTKLIKEKLTKLHTFAHRSGFNQSSRFPENEKYKTINEPQTLIALTDEFGKLLFANDDFFNLLDIKMNNFKSIRHPDMPKSIYLDLWATISTGLMWNGIICNKGKDGNSYWLSANVFPITKNDSINNYLAIYKEAPRDLTAEAILLYRQLP